MELFLVKLYDIDFLVINMYNLFLFVFWMDYPVLFSIMDKKAGRKMNKKQRYQGFRKFSIKTRLVIALLLISIIHWQESVAIPFISFP